MNALVLYHISDVQYSYTSKFFKKAIKYNLNINYEELLYYAFYVIANEEVIYENGKIKPRKIPLKLNVYEDYIDRGVFWRTLSNLLSTPNINLNVVKILFEQIKNNHENLYNMMICNIIDNKTIDFTKLDSNISSKIYSYSSDDSIRKLAQRIDIPIEILKKLMKFNDPIKDINLLNNPKSDKEIIEYIYNFTEYDYIKNKAQELLSKNKQNTKTLTKTKKH